MSTTKPLRIVIVDDSSFVRQLLRRGLEAVGGFEIVAEASDGIAAEAVITQHRPDAVTMDVLMPMRGGLETIRAIVAVQRIPIVVVADPGASQRAFAVEALAAGAVDVFAKPKNGFTEEAARELAILLRAAARPRNTPGAFAAATPTPPRSTRITHRNVACIGIVASTGGPRTLAALLEAVKMRNVPIAIVQHTTSGFGPAFADWLGRTIGRPTPMAVDGYALRPGDIIVAPDDFHLEITSAGTVALLPPTVKERMCPSGDRLLRSIALSYGARSAGLVLTGLGADGAEGLRTIAEAGGATAVQAPETAIVAGMPNAAASRVPHASVGPVAELSAWIDQSSGR
ncbi:MAG TPA: chemotaxis protein CheB [Kofleriaceae bacterium]|nr:chemotaxis protein CheB [Kofleriaceae bacterium]